MNTQRTIPDLTTYVEGSGCLCNAWTASECGCTTHGLDEDDPDYVYIDWTPLREYKLLAKIQDLQAKLCAADYHLAGALSGLDPELWSRQVQDIRAFRDTLNLEDLKEPT